MINFDKELLIIQVLKEYKLIDDANRLLLEYRNNNKGELKYGNSQQT